MYPFGGDPQVEFFRVATFGVVVLGGLIMLLIYLVST